MGLKAEESLKACYLPIPSKLEPERDMLRTSPKGRFKLLRRRRL